MISECKTVFVREEIWEYLVYEKKDLLHIFCDPCGVLHPNQLPSVNLPE